MDDEVLAHVNEIEQKVSHGYRARWALVAVILAWLIVTILGFVRIKHLVNENEARIRADAALSRRVDVVDARERKALALHLASRTAIVGAVVCNEQNEVKSAVRYLLTLEIIEADHINLRRRSVLRRLHHDLELTDCSLLARVIKP